MPTFVRPHDLDARAWRTATWSAPFVIQLVLGLLLVALWLLGKWPYATHSAHAGERTWMLTATAITTLASLVTSALLMRSPSARHRGLSLSLAGSSAVVVLGGILFAFLVLR